jgi:hypothetical protein
MSYKNQLNKMMLSKKRICDGFMIISMFCCVFISASFAQEVKKNTGTENAAKPDSAPVSSEINNSTIITDSTDLGRILLGGTKKPKSLMFNDEELGGISLAIDSFKSGKEYVPDGENSDAKASDEKEETKPENDNEKSYIYLGSIIFSSDKNWTVWINKQKIARETNKLGEELYIKSVTKDSAKVLWTLSISKWKILSGKKSEEFAPKINDNNQVEVEFSLSPNQTYILSSNMIMEGRFMPTATKKKDTNQIQKTDKQ